MLPDPKLSSFSNHLSKQPSLSLQYSDEREKGARRGESVERSNEERWGREERDWVREKRRKEEESKKEVKVLHFAT